MTDSVVTPAAEETLEGLNPISYDPSQDQNLTDQLELIYASSKIDPTAQARILAAVGKKEFPITLQYESLGGHEIRTLGELADSRANEHASQFLYPTSIKKITFGKYGIAKGHRLSSDIQICYRRNRNGEMSDFVITSGRHRVVSLIALLQRLGVKNWRTQKVQVSTKVVNSDPEFAQLIETANDSRRMPRAEVQVYGLTRSSIITSNPDEFYATCQKATVAQYSHVFAKAVQFEISDMPQTSQDAMVSLVGSAWNKCKAIKENQKLMAVVITNEDPSALRAAAKAIAGQLMSFTTNALSEFPNDKANAGATKLCARALAAQLGLTSPF